MVIEFTKATEEQKARAAEIGLLISGLGRKKAAIQTDRANHEAEWNKELAEIKAEEEKLYGELNDMGESLITKKMEQTK